MVKSVEIVTRKIRYFKREKKIDRLQLFLINDETRSLKNVLPIVDWDLSANIPHQFPANVTIIHLAMEQNKIKNYIIFEALVIMNTN